ncbi:2236_t:CDS:2 [Ambispora gerdemannii]|uniref:2236_t:CDS:1 n=1 Tax=Ambispora gerdemannii TaxID=144530 RepID=A0A9N9BBS7_9GLOM|nr:2236_t:CDS:2 [Ambispora gerdemannii]
MPPYSYETGNITRDRSVKLIRNALVCSDVPLADADEDLVIWWISGTIEICLFRAFNKGLQQLTAEYRQAVKTRVHNINTNPDLRKKIILRQIDPEEFSRMTSEQMCTEEKKEHDQQLKQELLFSAFTCPLPKFVRYENGDLYAPTVTMGQNNDDNDIEGAQVMMTTDHYLARKE